MLSDKDLHSIYNDGAQSDHLSGLRMVWDRAVAWIAAETAGVRDEVQSLIVKTEDVLKHIQLEEETTPEAPVVTAQPAVEPKIGDLMTYFGPDIEGVSPEPKPALISAVWSATCVNLHVYAELPPMATDAELPDPESAPTSVLLVQEGALMPSANYCVFSYLAG